MSMYITFTWRHPPVSSRGHLAKRSGGLAGQQHTQDAGTRAPVGIGRRTPRGHGASRAAGLGRRPAAACVGRCLPQGPSGSFAPKATPAVRAPRRDRRRAPGPGRSRSGATARVTAPCHLGLGVRGTPPPRAFSRRTHNSLAARLRLVGLACKCGAPSLPRRGLAARDLGGAQARVGGASLRQVSPRRPRPRCAKAGAIIGWRVDGIALTWSDRSQ